MATNEEIADALYDAGFFPKHISMMILDEYPTDKIVEAIDKLHDFNSDELREAREICKKASTVFQITQLALTQLELKKHEN